MTHFLKDLTGLEFTIEKAEILVIAQSKSDSMETLTPVLITISKS